MATLLYRIGHFAYRKAWMVIGVWIALLIAVLGGGLALGGQTQESFAIPGTESQQAIDHLDAVFPAAAGASAQVVYQAPAGHTISEAKYTGAINSMASQLDKVSGVANVFTPFSKYSTNALSEDGRMGITTVQFDKQSSEVTTAQKSEVEASATTARDAGLTVAFGGQVFQDTTFGITITEVFGVIFAAVVLIITFGSLLAAGMPLITALLGVGITMGGVIAVSAFTTVSSASPMLALMLGLAVGIDYALFILSRHRSQLAQGMDPEESAATAVATAGSAVVFAGATVIIALLGLLVVGIPFLSVMGLAAAFAVLVAIGVATTLVPAMLGLAGKRLIPKEGSRAYKRAQALTTTENRPTENDPTENNPTEKITAKRTMGLRWVNMVMKAPLAWVIAVVVILGTVAIPALSLDLNLPSGGTEPVGSTQRQAYDLIAEGFGPGSNGPLIVTVDITQTTDVMNDLSAVSARLAQVPGVASVGQGIPNPTVDTAIIQVIPTSAPDSDKTKELVQRIRDLEPSIAKDLGTPIAVTGSTAVAVDISNRLAGALIPFGLVVVGLSILLLMTVFRSIFVPIKAALGFLLSITASIGVVVAVFQWGWFANLINVDTPGPILSFLPIIMMALLFGLAMDYEVFLVSGMREEFVKSGKPKAAIRTGFGNAARVVTAAALIMFFVFFAFVPEGSGVIKGIALGLAIGIFFDAFLVRMTLVPAAMALAGKAAWWLPKWLARILPNVDIEGEGLRRHVADHLWAGAQDAAITADALCLGVEGSELGPVDFSVPRGGVLWLRGDAADRRVVAATIAGRLDAREGRLQVLGSALPSERSRAMRQVALCDVGAVDTRGGDLTVGEVLAERSELGSPWWRLTSSRRQVISAAARVADALDAHEVRGVPLTVDTTFATLGAVQRASVLVAAALTERPGIVFIDLGDRLGDPRRRATFIAVVEKLTSAGTTIVFGSQSASTATGDADSNADAEASGVSRLLTVIDLDSLARKGVLL
ncbi:MMPL family transporter [Rathayibacter soli]|uniref:MMPL family transporter n=1 Tax=Rathayibacter soli TaxID=3144168 RepID=UPI0027E5B6CC|nr:MMPL family transporter [Glaciibacter superstes]